MTKPEVTPQLTPEPTPGPQPVPGPTPVVPPTWRDGFTSDEYKNNDNFKKYGTVDDMGKAHLELVGMIGKKGVVLPNENDPNDMARYYNELGRPDEAAKYVNPEIVVEEDLKQFFSEEKLDNFKGIAHKYGLTQKQFEGLSKEYSEAQLTEIKGIIQTENQRVEESTKGLMNEWLVNYDANSKQSELALKSFGKGVNKDELDAFINSPLGKRVGFNMSQVISEDSFKKGAGVPTDTVQSIQSFIDSQIKVTDSSYYNNEAPDHKAVKTKVRNAYAQLESLRKASA